MVIGEIYLQFSKISIGCMGSASRAAFTLLVIICTVGSSLPVMAALRDYGIYLGSVGGSTLLRLENRLSSNNGSKRKYNTLTSITAVGTSGFIWDPRFMTVDLNLQYSTSRSESDTAAYDFDEDSVGFRFKSVLFPRWNYPYSPIRLSASKATRTINNNGRGSTETDYTRMSVSWGLVQKQLGRVRMRYNFSLEESTGTSERDTIKNAFQVHASKDFLKDKWGETRSRYGYEFDSSDDRVNDQFDIQHNLFINNRTKLGKKTDLSSNVLFYQRYYDGYDDDYVLSSNANLNIQETERFKHYYSLGLRSNSVGYDYSGTAGANYRYTHDFDAYLQGTASTGALARAGNGSLYGSLMQFTVNANGRLSYKRKYGVYQLNSNYSVHVRPPEWSSGSRPLRALSQELRVSQAASLTVSRRDNPLYSDSATLRADYEMAGDNTYSYSAGYSARSIYNISSKISSQISGNATASQRSREDSSFGFGSTAAISYRFGRSLRSSVNARQRWRSQGSKTFSLYGIRGRVSGSLYRRYNVRFSGGLGWTRQIEELQYNNKSPRDEVKGEAEVSSSMGKLVTSLRYTYRETDFIGEVSSDQSIMFEIKRFFGWRL